MIEISILRVMATREGFDKMFSAVPLKALEARTKIIVADIKRYYDTFSDVDRIDFVIFRDSFLRWHPNLAEEQVQYYDKILRHVEADITDVSKSVLINSMLELQLATDVAQVLEDYNNGEEVSVIHDIQSLVDQTLQAVERKDETHWIIPDMDEIIAEQNVENGLTWRLEILNEYLRPLKGGDMVLVAGRPDTGKTTFLSDNITHMATQLDSRPILWLNNEGPGQRIVSRVVQSALGINTDIMAAQHKEGFLQANYANAVGSLDRIRVIDIHDFWNWQVQELIELHEPKLVIMDMIDNIKFSGTQINGNSRTDQVLEEMYKWARNMGVKYDCVMMATSQISADGEGLQYPSMDMLKDSKTGKQGALDLQIMIGKSDDPILENSRFIGTPKNKLRMPGKEGYVRQEVFFNNEKARYLSPQAV